MLAVACGSGDDPTTTPATSTTTPGVPAPAPAPAGEAPPPAEPGSSDPAGPSGAIPAGPIGEPLVPVVEPPPVEEPPDPRTPPPPGAVGSAAAWYLQPDGASSILVEVRSQGGAEPRAGTVAHVQAVLARVTGKRVDVSAGTLAGGSRTWTAEEVRALADDGAPASPERGVLRVLFLQGGFAENERAVGVAVRGDVAAVFAGRVDEAAGVLGDPAAVEDAVTVHEVGHLLGLVDLVLATGRADPEHPGHSPNRGSVMYHAVESTLLGTLLSGGPPRDFDAADLADLAAIRDG